MSVWDAVVGQTAVVEQLQQAAANPKSMSHAWLFTGPPGSGRSVAARAFAAALECETQTGCGQCAECRMVLAGSHPDVRVVATELVTIKIDEVKELVQAAAARPAVGRYRVILMEDADRMTDRTVNVLLKAIEEPVPQTVWLLCAPTAQDVLPTIRSRCRIMTLQITSSAAVAALLVREGADPEVAAAAARASQSHIGRARWLAFDPGGAERRQATIDLIARNRSIPGAFLKASELAELAATEASEASDQRNAAERNALAAALGLPENGAVPPKLRSQFKDLEEDQKRRARRGQRDVLHRIFMDFLSLFRDVLMVQLGAQVELVNADSRSSSTLISMLANTLSPAQTLEKVEAIKAAQQRIDQNVPVPLALEALFVALRW